MRMSKIRQNDRRITTDITNMDSFGIVDVIVFKYLQDENLQDLAEELINRKNQESVIEFIKSVTNNYESGICDLEQFDRRSQFKFIVDKILNIAEDILQKLPLEVTDILVWEYLRCVRLEDLGEDFIGRKIRGTSNGSINRGKRKIFKNVKEGQRTTLLEDVTADIKPDIDEFLVDKQVTVCSKELTDNSKWEKRECHKHVSCNEKEIVKTDTVKQKQYVCTLCKKSFQGKVHLKYHIEAVHYELTPYECKYCGDMFTRPGSVTTHIRLKHTGIGLLTCEYCGKGFTHLLNLKEHIFKHTGERPYKCTQCNRGFTQRHVLASHIRLHTGEKPYHCPWCEMKYASNHALRSHIKRKHPEIKTINKIRMQKE